MLYCAYLSFQCDCLFRERYLETCYSLLTSSVNNVIIFFLGWLLTGDEDSSNWSEELTCSFSIRICSGYQPFVSLTYLLFVIIEVQLTIHLTTGWSGIFFPPLHTWIIASNTFGNGYK